MVSGRSEIKTLSPIERELSIVIPEIELQKELEKAYQRLNQKVQLKGFRPGKTPRSLLERHYKSDVEQDVIQKAVNQSYQAAIEQHQLQPVAQAELKNISPLAKGSDFSFTATVQIKPELAIKTWKGISVKAPVFEFNDNDIEKELEKIRKKQSRLLNVTDRTVLKSGDLANCKVEAEGSEELKKTLEGEETIELGSNAYFKEAEEALIGKELNTPFTVKVTLPEDFGVEALRGQTASLTLTPQSIQLRELPPLDDELAKDVSDKFQTLESLRQAVSDYFSAEKQRNEKAQKEDAIIDLLIQENPFEVPSGMVKEQAHFMASNMVKQLAPQKSEEAWKQLGSYLISENLPKAERIVKMALLLEAIAKEQQLLVTEEEVEAEFEKEATRMGVNIAQLKAYYKPDNIAHMKERLIADKAMQLIIDNAQITYENRPLRP